MPSPGTHRRLVWHGRLLQTAAIGDGPLIYTRMAMSEWRPASDTYWERRMVVVLGFDTRRRRLLRFEPTGVVGPILNTAGEDHPLIPHWTSIQARSDCMSPVYPDIDLHVIRALPLNYLIRRLLEIGPIVHRRRQILVIPCPPPSDARTGHHGFVVCGVG